MVLGLFHSTIQYNGFKKLQEISTTFSSFFFIFQSSNFTEISRKTEKPEKPENQKRKKNQKNQKNKQKKNQKKKTKSQKINKTKTTTKKQKQKNKRTKNNMFYARKRKDEHLAKGVSVISIGQVLSCEIY